MAMHHHKNSYLISLKEFEIAALSFLDKLLAYCDQNDLVSILDLKKFALELATTYDDGFDSIRILYLL
jgi:hypothetical protein